jgi:hypothetical protein
MGQMTQARIAAWQETAGIKEATGDRLKRLRQTSKAAYDLIQIIELEISGIRDGDGYWHGSDPLQGKVLEISDRWQLSNRAKERDAEEAVDWGTIPHGDNHEPPAAYEVASDPATAASHRQQAQNNSSVPNLDSMAMKYRWAKETIGMAALDLQKAYEEFVIEKLRCEYPTRGIEGAFKRLEDVRQAITPELMDEIPF